MSDLAEAKAELEKMRHDLAKQQAEWPRIRRVARALEQALETNHFAERLRIAQEGRGEHH